MGNQISDTAQIKSTSVKKQKGKKKDYPYKKEEWYKSLPPQQQQLTENIYKNHEYYSGRDRHYRLWVRAIKFAILFITMINTIILGVKGFLSQDAQVNIGLILSAVISFITALFTYFNLEEYWMRNITVHIKSNMLRDEFLLKVKTGELDENTFAQFTKELKDIQKENIEYWQKASKKI